MLDKSYHSKVAGQTAGIYIDTQAGRFQCHQQCLVSLRYWLKLQPPERECNLASRQAGKGAYGKADRQDQSRM